MSDKKESALQLFNQDVSEALMVGGYVAVPVIGGMATAQLGGEILKLITFVDEWVDEDSDDMPWRGAVVDVAGGTPLNAGVAAYVYKKNGKSAAVKTFGYMEAGTLISATAPIVGPKVEGAVDWVFDIVSGSGDKKKKPAPTVAEEEAAAAAGAGPSDFASSAGHSSPAFT